MPDPLTLQQRHLCMSHIRSKDTSPEMKLRRELWRRGYRYRERAQAARDSGHRARQIPQRHLRERLLLARTQGLPEIQRPQDQRRVLDAESRPQPGARPAQQPAARVNRLERDHGVGMRARESTAKRYGQPHRSRA